jgi:hypothetical protein
MGDVDSSLPSAERAVVPAWSALFSRSAYIVGPLYDWAFFLLPPIAALVLGIWVSTQRVHDVLFNWSDQTFTLTSLAIGVFIHAHLFIVFFRSHGNQSVLRSHPYRFTLVPALLYAGMLVSTWIGVIASVLATFWDVYHSGAQTFGFGRIYDAKAGNDPVEGRRLDFALNQLLYAGPILAGATMMDHFEDFGEFHEVGSVFFTSVPAFMQGHQRYFTYAVLGGGAVLVAYYVFANLRMARAGRNISWQKVFLYTSTGVVSVYTWGFNSFGEAFLIMNFFHALQYYGIVWSMEHKNMRRLFRLESLRVGTLLTVLVFVALSVGYGFAVEAWGDGRSRLWWSFHITVSLMHFWYDGFIWSVRKKNTDMLGARTARS